MLTLRGEDGTGVSDVGLFGFDVKLLRNILSMILWPIVWLRWGFPASADFWALPDGEGTPTGMTMYLFIRFDLSMDKFKCPDWVVWAVVHGSALCL